MNASSGSGLWPIRIVRIPGSVMAKVATRERLLDAALEVFARKGYHRASGSVEWRPMPMECVPFHLPERAWDATS